MRLLGERAPCPPASYGDVLPLSVSSRGCCGVAAVYYTAAVVHGRPWNTAVKRRVCAKGSALAGARQFPANLRGWNFVEGSKCCLKRKSTRFKHKAYATKIILLSKYHKICYTLLKHRDLLAWMVVCNTRVKTCLWPPESTPPSHYNVWTCATVGPLCWIAGASKYPRFWDYPMSLKITHLVLT